MDLAALRHHLRASRVPVEPVAVLGPDGGEQVAAWTDALERHLGDDPSPEGRALLVALDDLSGVLEEPWPVSHVRPDHLVRWDAWSSTWTGVGAGGAPVLVRALRATAARRPVLARAFRREVGALRRVLPVELGDTWVVLACAGWGVARLGGPLLVTALGSALVDLERWRAAGLAPAPPADDELRTDASGRVRVAGLTLAPDAGPAVASLFARIDLGDEGALADALRGAPTGLDDARARLVRAMAADLAARRHDLVQRWRSGRQADRRSRLRELVGRLQGALPAPRGAGAVGVDLDGRITVVRGEPGRVTFGPAEAPEVVWDPVGGFRPPLVRRMLRARALSPPNPVLDARVGGNAAQTEALCRWVAEGSKLRTLQLLLAVPG